jgi:hypothetical protein
MEYIAYCGLLCNECPVYIATSNNDEPMRAKLAEEYSNEHVKFSIEDIKCQGCFRAENKSSKMCGGCEIRNCAEIKNVKNCGWCGAYPCQYVTAHLKEGSENRKRLDGIKAGR